MSSTLTKAKIAEIISNQVGLSKKDSLEIVEDIINEIGLILAKEGVLKISSFGTFKVNKKKARIVHNPKTSKEVSIEEHNVVSFRPSKVVKNLLNKKKT
ncbi:MAG: integration host factor subunit alpha [Candidatus Mesenet longicola]|uniref:Histone-like DNA-binding protein n=1 Tax=Candidatus Mesenet longicola TaxID=1892558 RepID=A0A8J3HVN4_9RICK|nr:MAG: integration host factor subunit alpha [Candidatus Mesenet longicola]GHM59141.1 MAG: integration host factor subunit alpha [Candidatus Mesenet longicola]